jgi:competence protein ComGC
MRHGRFTFSRNHNPQPLKSTMKNSKFKTSRFALIEVLLTVAIIAILSTLALPALAQSGLNLSGINGSNSVSPSNLGTTIENMFSLHNTNNQYFINTNEVEFQIGTAYNTAHGGIDQEIGISYMHQSSPAAVGFGADAAMDSLGVGGQQVDFLAVHGKARFGWDNLAGDLGIGPCKDLLLDGYGGEAEFALKYRFSTGCGATIGYYPGWINKGGPKNRGEMFSRITASVTFAIGK